MPHSVSYGKDKVIFLTQEELKKPSTVVLPEGYSNYRRPGVFLPNGEINWECPCHERVLTGPCGMEYKEALICYQKSTTVPRGDDCSELKEKLSECKSRYPGLYPGYRKSNNETQPTSKKSSKNSNGA